MDQCTRRVGAGCSYCDGRHIVTWTGTNLQRKVSAPKDAKKATRSTVPVQMWQRCGPCRCGSDAASPCAHVSAWAQSRCTHAAPAGSGQRRCGCSRAAKKTDAPQDRQTRCLTDGCAYRGTISRWETQTSFHHLFPHGGLPDVVVASSTAPGMDWHRAPHPSPLLSQAPVPPPPPPMARGGSGTEAGVSPSPTRPHRNLNLRRPRAAP
jgi:hypothetical protein